MINKSSISQNNREEIELTAVELNPCLLVFTHVKEFYLLTIQPILLAITTYINCLSCLILRSPSSSPKSSTLFFSSPNLLRFFHPNKPIFSPKFQLIFPLLASSNQSNQPAPPIYHSPTLNARLLKRKGL